MKPCSLAFVPDHFKTQEICNKAVCMEPFLLKYVPDYLKTQEMCEKNVWLRGLYYVPDHRKTQGVSEKAVTFNPYTLRFVPDRFKTQEMINAAVMKDPCSLGFYPDHFKAQEICNKAVEEGSCALEFVPDWLVTHQQVKIWHDDDDNYYDKIIKQYKGYIKKSKARKAKIKDELMSIAWHPSRWCDWFVPEDEKRHTEKLFLTI